MAIPLASVPGAAADTPAAPVAFKLYSGGDVLLASVLGTPLAGCALMAINDRRLGRPRNATMMLVGGSAGVASLAAIAYVLPDDLHLNFLGLVAAIAMKPIYDKLQGPLYAAHVGAGGTKESGWAAAGMGVAVLVGVVGFVLAVALSSPSPFGTELDFGNSELFYGKGIAPTQAQAVADILTTNKFAGSTRVSIRLTRRADGYALGIVMNSGAWLDESNAAAMRVLAERVHHDFEPQAQLTMQLCDENFEVKRTIPADDLRPFVETGHVYVYYAGNATEDEARKLLATIRSKHIADDDTEMDLEVRREGAAYTLSFPLKQGAWDDPPTRHSFRVLGEQLGASALAGAPINVRLCDATWRVRATLSGTD